MSIIVPYLSVIYLLFIVSPISKEKLVDDVIEDPGAIFNHTQN